MSTTTERESANVTVEKPDGLADQQPSRAEDLVARKVQRLEHETSTISAQTAPDTSEAAVIYAITNSVNGKIYIGSARDSDRRFYLHRYRLERGDHPNHHLQNSWNKYGPDAFTFEVIEECRDHDRMERELNWIETWRTVQEGYNIAHPVKGEKPSEKLSAIRKARWEKLSEEEKRIALAHFYDLDGNRKTISHTMKELWKDPEFRAKRLAGLEVGRNKTNANPSEAQLQALNNARQKAIEHNRTDEARKLQGERAKKAMSDPVKKANMLEGLRRGRETQRARAAAKRAGNDIV